MEYYTYREISENGRRTQLYDGMTSTVTIYSIQGHGDTINVDGKEGVVERHHGRPFDEETYVVRCTDGKTDTLTLQYNPDAI